MQIQPYLFFEGRCEEAIEFYRGAGGRGDDADAVQGQPRARFARQRGQSDARQLRIGETTVLVSDGRCLGRPSFQGFALSLTVGDEAEAERLFAALGDGGQVQMPMAKTFFSPRFGMVADRFGVSWMVYVAS